MVLLAAGALAMTACGGSPGSTESSGSSDEGGTAADVLEQIEGLDAEARQEKLVELAAEEGNTLTFYTSVSTQVAEEWEAEFAEEFDIKVEPYHADQLSITRRVIQEVSAGYEGADVVESSGIEMAIAANAETMSPYEPPNVDELLDDSVRDDWVVTRNIQYTPTWNTDLVKPGEEPTSWEDLADPKWKGKLVVDIKDVDWYQGLFNYWTANGKTAEEVDEIFMKIFANARATTGHTSTTALLGGGEYSVYPDNYRYIAQLAVDSGAPLAFSPRVEPIVVQPNGLGIVRNAPHPATAILFADWLLSKQGQQIIVDNRLTPVLTELIPAEDADLEVLPDDIDGLIADYQGWQDRYAAFVANAGSLDESAG